MDFITNYFLSLGGWSWLILGGLLLAVEVLARGVFMLWLGLAAMVTGLITLSFSVGFQGQMIIFAITSLVSVLIGRQMFVGKHVQTDQPFLNEKGDQLVGKTFTVSKAIENGRGKVQVGDTVWSVTGPDAQQGARVKVTSVDGNRLTVEPVA